MINNKQQTAVDLFAERTFNLIELMKRKWVNQEEFLDGMLKARNEAKEMEKVKAFEIFKAGQDSMEEGGKGFEQWYEQRYGGNK